MGNGNYFYMGICKTRTNRSKVTLAIGVVIKTLSQIFFCFKTAFRNFTNPVLIFSFQLSAFLEQNNLVYEYECHMASKT